MDQAITGAVILSVAYRSNVEDPFQYLKAIKIDFID
jgi:hypothetical protein